MTTELLINAAAAFGQVAAAILALVAILKANATAREQLRMSERIAKEQADLQFEQVRLQRDSDILRWTERAIACMAECDGAVAAIDPAKLAAGAHTLTTLQMRLSALIDQGRLYFPNEAPQSKGQGNPVAYQGERQRILTVLVRAYEALGAARGANDAVALDRVCQELVQLRRVFVSEAQVAIDPRRFIALKEMNERRVGRSLTPQQSDDAAWSQVTALKQTPAMGI
jgi:hypothetical protein